MYRVAFEQSLSERDIITKDVDTVRALALKVSTIGLVGIVAALQFGLRTESKEYFSINLWWVGLGIGLFALLTQWIYVIYIIWTRIFMGQRSSAKSIITQDIEGADGKTKKVKGLSEFYRRMAISQEQFNDEDVKIVEKMLKARGVILFSISVEYVGVILAFVGASCSAHRGC